MDKNIDNLIIDCLDNTISNEDRKIVLKWVNENDKNKEKFDSVKLLWDNKSKQKLNVIFDVEQSLKRFKQKAYPKTIKLYTDILKYAAIIIFTVVGTLSFEHISEIINPNIQYTTLTVPYGEHDAVTLPDGSIVVLNSGSTIKYPKKFNGDNRLVSFSGEAYFNVKKNKEKPFIVKTPNITVEVLGTSFNVSDYKDDVCKSASLLTGKIKFRINKTNVAYDIRPNQKIVLNTKTQKVLLSDCTSSNSILWTSGIILFNNEPFFRVKSRIERAYKIKIKFKDKDIFDQRITGSFSNENAEDVMNTISKILELKYKKENNTYIFSKK